MVSSVTEGKDKPLMYPATFRSRDVVLLDKIDLVPFLDADVDAYIAHVREVNAARDDPADQHAHRSRHGVLVMSRRKRLVSSAFTVRPPQPKWTTLIVFRA